MSTNIENLKQRATEIKNETQESANTADRVGGLMYDMVGGIEDALDVSLDDLTDVRLGTPRNDQALMYDSSDGKWKNKNIPGGGGGGGSDGSQRTYFTNVTHGTVPALPSASEYDASNDRFNHNGQIWVFNNVNPAANQDTYMLWCWFSDGNPDAPSGPVKVYDSAGGGASSNGEDGSEIEWVYMLRTSEMSTQIYEEWRDNLAEAKGTSGYGGVNYTDAKAVPPSWEDHPSGIDPDNKYEYASFRVSSLNSNGKRIWGTTGFSAPILWAAYGSKGLDGDGVEYIYYPSIAGVAPTTGDWPPNWNENTTGKDGKTFQDNEFIALNSAWVDDPVDLGTAPYGPGSKQWVSVRKKRVWEEGAEPSWGRYSTPKLWSGIGTDGIVDGYLVSTYNSTMLVTVDSSGVVDSFTDSCGFEVFHNSIRVNYTDSQSQADTHYMLEIKTQDIQRSDGGAITGISASLAGNGMVTVTLTNVPNMDGTNITIPILVKLPDGSTRNSVITVTGIAAGEGGYAIDIYTSAYVIRTDYYEQNVVPSDLNIGVRIGKGENPNVYLSGATSNSAENLGYTFKYYYNGDDSSAVSIVGAIPIAKQKTSITVEMYYNNSYLESRTIPYVKDGEPGIGIAAVNYSIAMLSTSVAVNDTTVSGELHFKAIKTVGGVSTEITTSPFQGDGADGETIHVTINGQVVTPAYGTTSGYWTASYSGTYNDSYPFSQVYILSQTSTTLASTTVPIIKNGESSVQGLDAVVMRFRSYNAFMDGKEPQYGNIQNGTAAFTDGVIYKDIVLYESDGDYYYIAPTNKDEHTIDWVSRNPPAVNGTTGAAWVRFNRMGDAAFQALLAKYAFIENLTAKEIVVTDTSQKPVAGISSGTAVSTDGVQHSVIAKGGYKVATDKGNVRIWAGFDGDSGGNLYDSSFYVTDEGYLHAGQGDFSGTFSTLDGTVNVFSDGSALTNEKGIEIKPTANGSHTIKLTSDEFTSGTGAEGRLYLLHTNSSGSGTAATDIYPGGLTMDNLTAQSGNTRRVTISSPQNGGGQIILNDVNGNPSITLNGSTGVISGTVAASSNLKVQSFDLPSNPVDGQTIFCKGINADITINANGHRIIGSDNDRTAAQATETLDVERRSVFLIYNYQYQAWILFNCG